MGQGGGAGLVVSVLACYANEQSLNPAEVYNFCFINVDLKH